MFIQDSWAAIWRRGVNSHMWKGWRRWLFPLDSFVCLNRPPSLYKIVWWAIASSKGRRIRVRPRLSPYQVTQLQILNSSFPMSCWKLRNSDGHIQKKNTPTSHLSAPHPDRILALPSTTAGRNQIPVSHTGSKSKSKTTYSIHSLQPFLVLFVLCLQSCASFFVFLKLAWYCWYITRCF